MDQKYLYKIVLSAVIFNLQNKVLLVKRNMNEDVLPGYWGIPGGKAENRKDTDDFLVKELQREIKEEVGITIKNIRLLENHLHGSSGKVQIGFVCDIDKGEPKVLDEIEEVGWFTLEEAEKMKLTPRTFDRIKLAYSLRKK